MTGSFLSGWRGGFAIELQPLVLGTTDVASIRTLSAGSRKARTLRDPDNSERTEYRVPIASRVKD